MASRPIVIEFAANVRDFLRGSKDVQRATDDIADELKDATKAADKFEAGFSDAMRDAERAADRSSRKIDADFDKIRASGADAGKETGNEFQQNLGESIASGNLDDLLTDTLGGLVAGLKGPVGLAAAALAGVAAIAFQKVKEEAERVQDFVTSTAEALDGQLNALEKRLTNAEYLEGFNDWAESQKENLAGWADEIKTAGINMEDFMIAAYEGGKPYQDLLEILRETSKETETITTGRGIQMQQATEEAEAAKRVLDILRDNYEAQSDVREQQDLINAGVWEMERRLGLTANRWQENYNKAKEVLETVQNMPSELATKITFYAEGPGAAFINPYSASYSPGHSAIANMYVNRARAQ